MWPELSEQWLCGAGNQRPRTSSAFLGCSAPQLALPPSGATSTSCRPAHLQSSVTCVTHHLPCVLQKAPAQGQLCLELAPPQPLFRPC